jgi:hypothetical protein
MELPRVRFTVRRMMVAVTIVAALMTILAAAYRWIDETRPPRDPATWARRKVADLYQQRRRDRQYAAEDDWKSIYRADQEKRFAELAEEFHRLGARWAESTYRGPFTDKLATGEAVTTQLATRAESSLGAGTGRGDGEFWAIAQGTACTVLTDWAGDADDCSDSRVIEVCIVGGTYAGRLAHIERIYLRRRP